MTRRQPGQYCRLTSEQVAEIRSVYDRLCVARNERRRIQRSLDLTPDEFRRFGCGLRGNKPRDAA